MSVQLKVRNTYSQVIERSAKFWLEKFFDPVTGFVERLDSNGVPLHMGYTRLLTQCRMMYVFSQLYILTSDRSYLRAARKGYELIVGPYYSDANGFYFSLSPDGHIHDNNYDLYGHAFVLFGLSHYYLASKDPAVLSIAKVTLDFIKTHFKSLKQKGYYEALAYNLQPIKRVRRQNPHMHLFEACISMYEATQDIIYLSIADEIMTIFQSHFFDKNTSTLGEFFDDNLNSDLNYGHIVEPGHHFEWVSLLHRRLSINPLPIEVEKIKFIINQLFNWARNNGVDKEMGGIFNEVNRDGTVINSNKRIWALIEAIKAYSAILSYDKNDRRLHVELNNLLNILIDNYIYSDGSWVEICDRHLVPQTNYLPGTTPYHILAGLIEANELINNKYPIK